MTTSSLAWHGVVFELASEWEVTAHRLDAKHTQFRCHQRLRECGTLNLVRMDRQPQLEALAMELFARQDGVQPTVTPTLIARGPWIIAHGAVGLPFLALTWNAQECRAVHWGFPAWEAQPGAWIVALDGLHTGPGDVRTWELFGARAILPRTYTPSEVDAQPAAIRIDFTADGWADITARRFGMASVLLEQRPLSSWLKRSLAAANARVENVQDTTRAGMPAVRVQFSVLGERPFDRVAWRRWPGEAWWWHDVATNRILGLEQVGAPRLRRVELAHAW